MRGGLQAAFLDGLGAPAVADDAAEYPLIASVSRGGVSANALPMAPGLARQVAVKRIADPQPAVALIVDVARAGGAVAWVRKAVGDTVEATEAPRAAGLDPLLFHARFAMRDRRAIERGVLSLLGPHGPPANRKGRALAATQVVEQSLDLDSISSSPTSPERSGNPASPSLVAASSGTSARSRDRA